MVMEIIHIDPFQITDAFMDSCACIGYFDGIHKGHVQLIEKCLSKAKNKQVKSAFITFDPDPWTIFHKDMTLQHLTTLQDKYQIIASYGIDIFYEIHFTKEFASFSVDQFHKFLYSIGIRSLVCGFDFRYAFKNSGDIHTLKAQSYFDVDVIDSVNLENAKISTSRIEPLIEKGEVKKANDLLGYIYSIQGVIEHGFRRGTDLLKIPTANLKVDPEYIIPRTGVYAGYVKIQNKFHKAMINVGKNPTFDNKDQTIEAHIIDFDEDIYDQKARFYFYDLIREEMKFASFEDLKNQLHQDVETTRHELEQESNLMQMTKNIWNK